MVKVTTSVGNYFENATVCSKRKLKMRVATCLNLHFSFFRSASSPSIVEHRKRRHRRNDNYFSSRKRKHFLDNYFSSQKRKHFLEKRESSEELLESLQKFCDILHKDISKEEDNNHSKRQKRPNVANRKL